MNASSPDSDNANPSDASTGAENSEDEGRKKDEKQIPLIEWVWNTFSSWSDAQKVSNVMLCVLFLGVVFALLGGGIYALWWGLGAFLSGGFIGFLFGIPRVVQSPAGLPEGNEAIPYAQRVNTNLEQISDWLTKIIVGFGLIQLQQIPGAFEELAEYVAGDDYPPSLAGSIILFFSVTGFLTAYLVTRLYVAGALGRADQKQFDKGVSEIDSDGSTQIPDEIEDIIENAPASAVELAYRKLEKSLKDVTEKRNLPKPEAGQASYVPLFKNGLLDNKHVVIARQLENLRNMAVSSGKDSVQKSAAKKYVQSALDLSEQVKKHLPPASETA